MAEFFYDDGGSNTAPYDTWAKAATTLAAIIAGGLAAGDTIWIGNDTAGEGLTGATTYTFPGTSANPCKLISVQKDATPGTLLAGAIISIYTNGVSVSIAGGVYIWGVKFKAGTVGGVATGFWNFGTSAPSCILDNCTLEFVGTGASYFRFAGTNSNMSFADNCTIKYTAVGQRVSYNTGKSVIRNLTIDPTGTAPTGIILTLANMQDCLIENCDLSAGARGLVIFPAICSYPIIGTVRNCKLPANWNGTLCAGDAMTTAGGARFEMFNCDSGDTNYRIIIIDYFGKLVQETTLVANAGASDGSTRLSWKIVATAYANKFNPFICPKLRAWVDTEATQKTATVEIISSVSLNDNEVWLDLDYSANTTDPKYSRTSDRTVDLVITAPVAQTASTKDWDDLVAERANTTGYSLGNLIKVASNPGRVFICTSAGTSAGSEPAEYASAVDGGSVTDNGATFQAMYRQKLVVACPASKPANKGWLIGIPKIAKASATVYIDPNMSIS